MMKLGIIGAGRHGSRYVSTCREIESALTRSGALYPGTKPACGRFEGPRVHTELTPFFEDCLDGVIVATPPRSHRELCIAALERGIPVLVEKPLALTAADCEDIVRCAELNGVPLLVAHLHLFDQIFEQQFLVNSPPTTLFTVAGGPDDHANGNYGDQRYSVLQDWGPHDVAMAIAANRYRLPDEWSVTEAGDNAWIRMRWDTRRATCTVGRFGEKIRRFETSDGRRFPGEGGYGGNTIGRITDVFKGLIRGETDARASYAFTRAVYRVLYTSCRDMRSATERMEEAVVRDLARMRPMETC